MDGMCRMMGGLGCGWWGLLVWLGVIIVILALVVAIVALARGRDGPKAPGPPA